jgi:hypothetical protein
MARAELDSQPEHLKKDGIMAYGLVGILVVILLVVLIVYFVRRA